jgi:hypothetical protein
LRSPIELVLAALLLAGATGVFGDARTEYVLHCMGCHLADGKGSPPAVPTLTGHVGYYLQVPGGRDYLVQVPGAANAPLSDTALAGVLNWIVGEFALDSAPPEWTPFTGAEVARTRRAGPVDVDRRRHELWAEIERRFGSTTAPY